MTYVQPVSKDACSQGVGVRHLQQRVPVLLLSHQVSIGWAVHLITQRSCMSITIPSISELLHEALQVHVPVTAAHDIPLHNWKWEVPVHCFKRVCDSEVIPFL